MQAGWIFRLRLRLRQQARRLVDDTRGIVAVEFVLIVPMMLMIFFGSIQVSNVVSAGRKVSLIARTLSDMISQASTIVDADITNAFASSTAILSPYPNTTTTPVKATITQIHIDKATLAPKIVWSKGSNTPAYACTDPVPVVPPTLLIADSFLILSEVKYDYQPVVGYDIKTKFVASLFKLSDSMFTRPRQSPSVTYTGQTVCPNSMT